MILSFYNRIVLTAFTVICCFMLSCIIYTVCDVRCCSVFDGQVVNKPQFVSGGGKDATVNTSGSALTEGPYNAPCQLKILKS